MTYWAYVTRLWLKGVGLEEAEKKAAVYIDSQNKARLTRLLND